VDEVLSDSRRVKAALASGIVLNWFATPLSRPPFCQLKHAGTDVGLQAKVDVTGDDDVQPRAFRISHALEFVYDGPGSGISISPAAWDCKEAEAVALFSMVIAGWASGAVGDI
jgi:hypothetical protein